MRFFWRWLYLFRVCGIPVQAHTTWMVFPVGFMAWIGWAMDGFRGMAEARWHDYPAWLVV